MKHIGKSRVFLILQNYIVNRKKGTPTMAEEKETKNPVQSAERIFQVLEMLAEHGEMGLMEISTELGLHKSTVHRLLMDLYGVCKTGRDNAEIHAFLQNREHGGKNLRAYRHFTDRKTLYGAPVRYQWGGSASCTAGRQQHFVHL